MFLPANKFRYLNNVALFLGTNYPLCSAGGTITSLYGV
ncbi:hypothetical protein ACB092_04G019700 [Castanea dentata]